MRLQYKTGILSFLAILLFASCQDYLDINENPNAATEPPVNGLLASTTYNTAMNTFLFGNNVSYYTQYLASPNPGATLDTYEDPDFSSAWNGAYQTMTDISDMKQLAQDEGASHHEAVGNILMAYHLAIIADIFNGGPYSQAFDGEEIMPVWDSGPSLYNVANDLLDQADDLLKDDSPTRELSTSSDVIHDGNINAWKKTLNSLKARLANHLSKTQDYNAQTVLDAVSNAYDSNDEDMQVNSWPVRNPWAQVAMNNENLLLGGWLSAQFIQHMNGDTYGVFDPRLPLITDTTVFGDYRGTVNGAGRSGGGTESEECYLELTGFYSSENAPLMMLTYAEMKFIEAEAALRSDDAGRAYTAYREGIRANMEKIGVDAGSIMTYMSHPVVDVGEENLTTDHIFKEKYAAMFLNPEAWNDARRHDYNYADFELPENANLNEFIRMVTPPETERDLNSANVPDVELTDRIFWDQ